MLIEEISIAVGNGGPGAWKQTGTHKALALCDELWAVHPDGFDEETTESLFTVTHRPTGRSIIGAVTWNYALELLRAIRRRPIDWAFTDPDVAKSLKAEWEEIKAEARRAVGGVFLDEVSPAYDAVDPHVAE